MINDNNNNNKSLRSTTAILHTSTRSLGNSFLSRIPTSIYLYIGTLYLGIFPSTTRYKKWGSDSKYPKRAIESDKNGLAGGNQKKGEGVDLSLSLSLSSPIVEMKPRDFLYIYLTLGR